MVLRVWDTTVLSASMLRKLVVGWQLIYSQPRI